MNEFQNLQVKTSNQKRSNNMEKLRPLRDNVIVVNFERGERTSSGGIIIADDDGKEHGIRARWAEVYAVGRRTKRCKSR